MVIYPKEYTTFAQLVKINIELNLLLKVLAYDIYYIQKSALKMNRAYCQLLEQIQLQIQKDIPIIRSRMSDIGGRIVSEEQERTYRVVQTQFRGYMHTHRFANDVLRTDCEQLLAYYTQGKHMTHIIEKLNDCH